MQNHAHYYKVLRDDSVWGETRIHAVMKCVGFAEHGPCRARLIKMLTYRDLEKKGGDRPIYFYRESAMAEAGGFPNA